MKVRNGFVTNSSSVSYGAIHIECKPLVEMFDNYKKTMESRGLGKFPPGWSLEWDDTCGTIEWCWDEDGPSAFYVPKSIDELLSCLCGALANEVWGDSDAAPIGPLIRAISECQASIEPAIASASWDNTDHGWGGDDESRYDKNSYSPEMLQDIKEAIAAEHGYSVDDITEYDFNIYVGEFTSYERDRFEYDRVKGIEAYNHDFSLM